MNTVHLQRAFAEVTRPLHFLLATTLNLNDQANTASTQMPRIRLPHKFNRGCKAPVKAEAESVLLVSSVFLSRCPNSTLVHDSTTVDPFKTYPSMPSLGDKYKDVHADRHKYRLMLAGAVSGATSRTVISPFYRITVFFQVGDMKGSNVPTQYTKHVLPALRHMWSTEGLKGLFRGNGTHLIKKVPFAAIKFSSYESYKQLFTKSQGVASSYQRLGAGALAALTAAVLTYPLDLIQTRLTVQTTTKYQGILHCATSIVAKEGYFGLYRGLGVCMLSVVPYMSINLTIWEKLKVWMSPSNSTEPSPFRSGVAGACSSAIASTITFPLDLMRRRQQVLKFPYLQMIKVTFKDYGWRGFFRGCWPHYLTVVPAVGFSMAMYDLMKIVLEID